LGYQGRAAWETFSDLQVQDDGVTVSGFWDSRRSKKPPAGYEINASGKYSKLR